MSDVDFAILAGGDRSHAHRLSCKSEHPTGTYLPSARSVACRPALALRTLLLGHPMPAYAEYVRRNGLRIRPRTRLSQSQNLVHDRAPSRRSTGWRRLRHRLDVWTCRPSSTPSIGVARPLQASIPWRSPQARPPFATVRMSTRRLPKRAVACPGLTARIVPAGP